MAYKTVDKNKILEHYNNFVNSESHFVNETELDLNHKMIRDFLKNNYDNLKEDGNEGYKLDLELGLAFYNFMNKQRDFVPKYKSNNDFWKYVAVYDIPDVIADRFGINAEEHFYKKNIRIYPYTLYWYIHLSWQGSIESTRAVLKDNSTDEILQLVERPSRIGINLELYREIMRRYSLIPKENRTRLTPSNSRISLFRIIMIKNTTKLLVVRPELYPGGIKGYVDMLFNESEVN